VRKWLIAAWAIGGVASALTIHQHRCKAGPWYVDIPFTVATGALWPAFVVGRIGVWSMKPDLALMPLGCDLQKQQTEK
jgi:hypothetical protein